MRAIGSWSAATVPVTNFVILPSCIKINVPHVVNKLSATQQNIMAKITDLMRMSRGQRCVVGKRKVDGKEQRVIKGRGSSVKRTDTGRGKFMCMRFNYYCYSFCTR